MKRPEMKVMEAFGCCVPNGAVVGLVGDEEAIRQGLMEASVAEAALSVHAYELDGLGPMEKLRARQQIAVERRSGGTLLLASWDEDLLRDLVDEVWWVNASGAVVAQGDSETILADWRRHIARLWVAEQTGHVAEVSPRVHGGDGRATVRKLALLNAMGQPVLAWMSGERAEVRVDFEYHGAVEKPVVGMLIRTRIGLNVYGTNTELEELDLGARAPGDRMRVAFTFHCDLCPGEYTLTVASHDPDGTWHEWLEDAVAFSVADVRYTAGVANLRAKVRSELY